MKNFLLFLSLILFFSCSQNSESIVLSDTENIEQNSPAIQKPTFETIDRKNILLVPSVDAENIFAARSMYMYLHREAMFDVMKEGVFDGGQIFGVYVQGVSTPANFALTTHTDAEVFVQDIYSAWTMISTTLPFDTDLILLKDAKDIVHRDLPSAYTVAQSDNILTSAVQIYPSQDSVFPHLEISQYDVLGREKKPEKIFVDFEKIRDTIEVEVFSFSVDFDDKDSIIPKVTIFEKNGEKIEIKTVFLGLLFDGEIAEKMKSQDVFYWCYENHCMLDISQEKLKQIDFVEFSYVDGKKILGDPSWEQNL